MCVAFESFQIQQLLHLWNDAPIFILVFSLTRSSSFFLHCFYSSVLLFLLLDVANGRTFFCSVVSPPFFTVWVWPGKSRHCSCVGEGHCPVHTVLGRWGCQQYSPAWLTPLRHSPWLWLVVLIWERWILANQITATGWSHRQLNCLLFYCQIVMTILANIAKK